MKVLPLPCKQLDLRVARLTMKNGDPVSSRRLKNSVTPNQYFRAKYLDTQIKWVFYMEIIFHSDANKTHFHKKGCALGLILKVRVLELRSGLFLQHFDFFHDLQLNRHFIQRNVTCSIKLIEHSKLLFITKSIFMS